LGDLLLAEITQRAEEEDYHNIVGAIDGQNEISIKLHEKHGFHECGRIKEAGYKFGKWLDVIFMQKILKGPKKPTD
ncbi:MAG: GNAT family N-acetyltransferase, partial [Lentisphaeraceae bacterium]|nr:GNAT family N-acetyltransferase [Lentisphaeraceae bacterium]